ncbi:winged helix-turn-helix domain-containing protein [Dongia deserti]|uniref:winged helix-turn-helix domain-containing protein n=1 Tax=Dongia deserti TaxID=2268030 RepID=UPI000E6483D0|nr:winged helix-turn-helix domain-containing tetratricopeptide repeat protein [Dongia deserti]
MRFQFEDFVLDPDRRELARGIETIALGPQVFDLLLHLVRNREHVVTKDNLIDVVWGGRIVSESTLTSHINAVRKAIGDTGEEQRLVRTIARKGYRFVGDVREADASKSADAAKPDGTGLAVPDRPSIAVLPFLNLSGDPSQDYFVDGVVDDIISALSRMRWLFVIARNSSFTYKGRAVDVKQVGRELGVRYVLEGSIRKAANRVRITGQLVDANTGATLWSERFESALDDIFELQDQMATSIVGALVPHLESAEIERARHKPTENLDAYDYYSRGMWKFRQVSRSAIDEALPLFYEAIERDRGFASAYAMAAWCHSWRKLSRWVTDLEREVSEGTRLARRAVELGQDDAVALAASAHALAHLAHDFDGSIALLDRALVLDPNLAAGWYLGGFLRIWRGELDEAIDRIARGMRLSPLGPDMQRMEVGTAMAHLLAGRTEDALSWAEKASRHMSDQALPITILAAIYARAGRGDEAGLAMQQLRRLDPALRLSNLGEWLPFQRPQDLATFADALREAGLPE